MTFVQILMSVVSFIITVALFHVHFFISIYFVNLHVYDMEMVDVIFVFCCNYSIIRLMYFSYSETLSDADLVTQQSSYVVGEQLSVDEVPRSSMIRLQVLEMGCVFVKKYRIPQCQFFFLHLRIEESQRKVRRMRPMLECLIYKTEVDSIRGVMFISPLRCAHIVSLRYVHIICYASQLCT